MDPENPIARQEISAVSVILVIDLAAIMEGFSALDGLLLLGHLEAAKLVNRMCEVLRRSVNEYFQAPGKQKEHRSENEEHIQDRQVVVVASFHDEIPLKLHHRPFYDEQVNQVERVADVAEEPERRRLQDPLKGRARQGEYEACEGANSPEEPLGLVLCVKRDQGLVVAIPLVALHAGRPHREAAVAEEEEDKDEVDWNFPIPRNIVPQHVERHRLAQVFNIGEKDAVGEVRDKGAQVAV